MIWLLRRNNFVTSCRKPAILSYLPDRLKRPNRSRNLQKEFGAGCGSEPSRRVSDSEGLHANLPDSGIPTIMATVREKRQLMSASEIDRTLVRLAHEVLEKTDDLERLAFVGIKRRGLPLARRLAAKIQSLEGLTIPVGDLDINLYRDDLSTVGDAPIFHAKQIDFPVTGLDVVLMDDVLYTGRTVRSALDALFDHGRPSRVQLLVLIDRGHRELPIEARYVGRMVQTSNSEIIEVKFQEIDEQEKVMLVERVENPPAQTAG
jgi:pyrimidine operon attenuation protein/uracil phosphoribosyltransferase